jgi:glycosyltransferase involved in cell wall biosynthesis
VRTRDLIGIFRGLGWRVTYASIAKENEASAHLRDQGLETRVIAPNDPGFDTWIREARPDFVLFDRFILEEQFGWRVEREVPHALRITDMQDFHALRRAREREFKETGIPTVTPELRGPDLYRELGAIYRSDLTLVISRAEHALLRDLGVPDGLLHYFPLVCDMPGRTAPFAERQHFAAIGNFRHAPNADAFHWLKRELWPLIRARLPRAELHVYGAYPSKEIMAFTDAKSGFYVKGSVDDAVETLARYRVNLAPLRFGAGLKGKIVDGWCAGTPVVTTAIGAEGLADELARESPAYFGGAVAESAEKLADRAVALHEDPTAWEAAVRSGARIAASELHRGRQSRALVDRISALPAAASESRRDNLVGAMLREHLGRSTEYFSRWIEVKNQLARALQPPQA